MPKLANTLCLEISINNVAFTYVIKQSVWNTLWPPFDDSWLVMTLFISQFPYQCGKRCLQSGVQTCLTCRLCMVFHHPATIATFSLFTFYLRSQLLIVPFPWDHWELKPQTRNTWLVPGRCCHFFDCPSWLQNKVHPLWGGWITPPNRVYVHLPMTI